MSYARFLFLTQSSDLNTGIDLIREHIERVASTPRPTVRRELKVAQAYAESLRNGYGWQLTRHVFSTVAQPGICFDGVNLIARRVDFDPALPRLCIGKHIDSMPHSPGADDNSSAVTMLFVLSLKICIRR